MRRIADRLLRSVAEIGERMAELVRKLKAVLRPMSVLGGQANGNTAIWCALEIGLRMIGTMIDIDTIEVSPWAVAPNFKRSGLQDCDEIFGTNLSKPAHLDPNIKWSRMIRRARRTVDQEQKDAVDCQIIGDPGVRHNGEGRLGLLVGQITSN